jgi:hypothetical protein
VGERKLFRGPCVGGPMGGKEGETRFQKGFILVDKPNRQVWVYRATPDGNSPTGTTYVAEGARDLDSEKLEKTAAGSDWDVRAYDIGYVDEDLEVGL